MLKPITAIVAASALFGCRPTTLDSELLTTSYAEGDIYIALSETTNGLVDVAIATASAVAQASLCAYEQGQSEDDGVCYPAEADGTISERKKFKVAQFRVDETLIVKIKGTTGSGDEIYRKVRFQIVGSATTTTPDTDQTDTDGTVDPNASDTASPLPDQMNLALKTSAGESTELSAIFKKKYLLVELSAYDCGPCRSFASNWNREASQWESYFQPGSSCDKLVLIGNYGGLRGRLTDWTRMLGETSFLGKSSYGTSLDLGAAARNLGFDQGFGIPTLILVDRTGSVVDSAVNSVPKKVREICQQ